MVKKGWMKSRLTWMALSGILASVPLAAQMETYPAAPENNGGGYYSPGDVVTEDPIIPNAPLLAPTKVLEITAVGMGVAPETTISPAQALALAKRAAIIDAYRQIGEKMYGIRINGKETVKDMVLRNSTVRTKVLAVIKNAQVVETKFEDGLCQVSMELKLDGRRWYGILTGRRF